MSATIIRVVPFLAVFLFSSTIAVAQQETDFMRSMGKMYVVVAVIAVIFLGIVLFLVHLDRKLTKLENQIHHHDDAKATH